MLRFYRIVLFIVTVVFLDVCGCNKDHLDPDWPESGNWVTSHSVFCSFYYLPDA